MNCCEKRSIKVGGGSGRCPLGIRALCLPRCRAESVAAPEKVSFFELIKRGIGRGRRPGRLGANYAKKALVKRGHRGFGRNPMGGSGDGLGGYLMEGNGVHVIGALCTRCRRRQGVLIS
uniref:Uncharacterized protein n=1 Tax=Steinernema glaseri TaxID=37863 RepID=A0A1I7ZAK6_9BILA